MSTTDIIFLPHYCILEVDNLYSIFTSQHMERNFAPESIILKASPIANVDDLDHRFGIFELIKLR